MVFNFEVVKGEPAFLGDKKAVQKVLILLHKQTKWRFHLTVFVYNVFLGQLAQKWQAVKIKNKKRRMFYCDL